MPDPVPVLLQHPAQKIVPVATPVALLGAQDQHPMLTAPPLKHHHTDSPLINLRPDMQHRP